MRVSVNATLHTDTLLHNHMHLYASHHKYINNPMGSLLSVIIFVSTFTFEIKEAPGIKSVAFSSFPSLDYAESQSRNADGL